MAQYAMAQRFDAGWLLAFVLRKVLYRYFIIAPLTLKLPIL